MQRPEVQRSMRSLPAMEQTLMASRLQLVEQTMGFGVSKCYALDYCA